MASGSIGNQSVESLILQATNPLNQEDDPNLIQSVCHAVGNEAAGVHSAIRLLIHKMQSPQEKEAMQSLLVLQACVNNCGVAFQSEIGKFRFLNEIIRIVSPKYLGNQTAPSVKKRVTELMYTWTVDLPEETKILEAYAMLKKQGIIKETPAYLGTQASPLAKPPAASPDLENEEKSRTLQRLLQSTRPEDVIKANAIIKHMVKEDERKLERTSRRIVEVETALNNAKVLDDMLNRYEESGYVTQADMELMEELKESCATLRSNIHRTVSEMDGKEEGLGELIKACDELFRVMGRYKLVAEMKSKDGVSPKKKAAAEDALLDLSTPPPAYGAQSCDSVLNDLLGNLTNEAQSSGEEKGEESILRELGDILSKKDSSTNQLNNYITAQINSIQSSTEMPAPLIPDKRHYGKAAASDVTPGEAPVAVLNELDALGSALIQVNLPQNVARLGPQFKVQEKISLNDLKRQSGTSLPGRREVLDNSHDSESDNKDNVLFQSLEDVCLLDSAKGQSDERLDSYERDSLYINNAEMKESPKSVIKLKDNLRQPSSSVEPQYSEVKPMNDLNLSLDDIKPGNQSPLKLIESNGLTMMLHFTENKPREDVSIVVVSLTSVNSKPVTNYTLQAVVTKGCKVRLLTPSSTKLCEYSPFLPPPAITQIMLIANPNQLNISLKVMLSYSLNEDPCSDMGEIDVLPL